MRISTSELRRPDQELLPYLNHEISGDMSWVHEYLKAPVCGPYAHILDLLTPEALDILNELPIQENGKCPDDELQQNPVAGPLIKTMGNISLMNRYNHPQSTKIKASARHESGYNLSSPPHRDFLDGHAVIFNWDCEGSLKYVINGKNVAIDSNEIIVINGAAESISIKGLTQMRREEDFEHSFATSVHSIVGDGFTSRKRLLVYADGVATTTTQIPA